MKVDLQNAKKLFLLRRLDKPGGAEESLKTLERSFEQNTKLVGYSSEHNEEYESVTRMFTEKRILPAEMFNFVRYLSALLKFGRPIRDFDPDIIFSQHEQGFAANIWGSGSLNVFFIRDPEFLHNKGFKGSYLATKFLNLMFSKVNNRISNFIMNKSDLVIANSDFMGEKYEEEFGISYETVYPFVELDEYRVESGEKLLHVNPSKSKGIELTLEIAEEMEDEEFIVAGETSDRDIKRRMEKLDNVTHLGYLDDMKEAYSQTKIVLMPSKWEEPYGRIPIEAGASGIPAVATKKGGLPESVGDTELLVEENPESFIEKIRDIQEDYKSFSEAARENAKNKSQQKQLEKLRKALLQL
jgi:glycosyltransferase involved in cell wall biosynthesis